MPRHAPTGHAKSAHPHEKPHHPHWPLAVLLFGFVFALGLLSVHESATWLHIATGKWAAAHRAIPATDPFSYTVGGRPWTTDSWLADWTFWLVDRALGPAGLIALKAAILAAGFALLLPVNPASPLIAAGVLGAGALSAWTGFTERPLIFDLLLLALMIRALRPRKLFHWTMVVHVAAIELAWANLHGTTAVLGVWLIALKVFKASLRTEKRERLNYVGLLVVAWLALLCNPHGAGVVTHIFGGLEASATSWQPLSSFFNLQLAFMAAGAAACAVTLQQEFFLTVTAASLIGLGILVPELRPLSILASCPTIALALGHFVAPLDDSPERVAKCAAAMTAALGLHWLWVTIPLAPARGYAAASLDGAIQYLRANDVRGRMFNEPATGGMIVAATDRRVFVDERRVLYGPAFLSDAEQWPVSFPQLARIFGFDYAVIQNRRAGYPARVIDEDPAWALLYSDDSALVYARKTGADGWLIPAGTRKLLSPNELWPRSLEAALAKPATSARALAELDAWIVQSPDGIQPLLWKAYAFDLLKLPSKSERLLALAQSRPGLARDPELMAALGYVFERRGDALSARLYYGRARRLAARRGETALREEIERRLASVPPPSSL